MRVNQLAIVAGLAIAGCAVTSVDGERLRVRSDAFSDYVEAVFRRQNGVATELAFALDAERSDSERYRELEQAELALRAACDGLNEMARLRRDGERVGGFGALRRARRAPECERATNAAASLLE